jgi:hypothetical protein
MTEMAEGAAASSDWLAQRDPAAVQAVHRRGTPIVKVLSPLLTIPAERHNNSSRLPHKKV